MGLTKAGLTLDVAEYLEAERDGEVRHEYVAGHVYEVGETGIGAGASVRHNRIAGNIFTRLSVHLDGADCEPFISDMKVRVAPDLFYYPDVFVACDPPGGDSYFRTEPRLVVEVLSPSTEHADRREKLAAYRDCASVQEYALVSQDGTRVELHRRAAGGRLAEVFDDAEDRVTFDSVGLTLSLRDIYRNVRFDNPAEG